jgi:hypothetical protein
LEKYKFTKEYDWWGFEHHANFEQIKKYFYSRMDLAFLEIGVCEGKTTVWLLDNVLTGSKSKIWCIDPYITENGRYNLYLHESKVILHRDTSEKILSGMLLSHRCFFDFIYVDGDHNASVVLQDLILSWRLLKVKGIMLIDDYEMETTDPWFYKSHREFNECPKLKFTHPRIAIDAFLNIYRGQYEMIIDGYQIGVKKLLNFPG